MEPSAQVTETTDEKTSKEDLALIKELCITQLESLLSTYKLALKHAESKEAAPK